jgi:peptidoglycan/xylan/chitin deacetylase (PgdA/CDA1 family)
MKKNIYCLILLFTTVLNSAEILPLDLNGNATGTVTDREMNYYKITASAFSTVTVNLSNVNGDPDLYIKSGEIPTINNFDKSSENSPNVNEDIKITLNVNEDIYIGVYGYPNGFLNAKYSLSVKESVPLVPLNKDIAISLKYQDMKYYKILGKKGDMLKVSLSNVVGDSDLYLKKLSKPTIGNSDMSSLKGAEKDESIELALDEDGELFIGVYGFTKSNCTLNVTVVEPELLSSGDLINSRVNYHEMKYYRIAGKAGDKIEITLDNVINDPDLYLQLDKKPTTVVYTEISDNGPNLNELATIVLKNDENLYIGVYGYNGYPDAGYTLKVKIVSTEVVIVPDKTRKKVYEDGETQDIRHWEIVDNIPTGAQISNVYDSKKKSRVIVLTNPNSAEPDLNGYQLNTSFDNEHLFNIKWDMKTTEAYMIDIFVTTQNGNRILRYSDYDETYIEFGEEFIYGLGKASLDGEWHTFYRNLEKDLKQAESNNKILKVNKFVARAKASLDNIELYADANKVYENAEEGTASKWKLYSNVGSLNNISNENDPTRGNKVISFNAPNNTHKYIIGGEVNSANAWNDLIHENIKWSMNHNGDETIKVIVNTENGVRYISYTNQKISFKNLNQNELIYGLGQSSNNGEWHTYIRDLSADIKLLEPNNKLISVEGLIVSGKMKIDEIELFFIEYPSTHGSGWSLTFDDATIGHWFSFRDKFLQYNIKPTFFVSHFLHLDNEDIGWLKTLENDGAEIGCHTAEHGGIARDYNNDPNRIQEYLDEQIIPVFNAMKAEGFNPVSFAHPYGETDKVYDEALRVYFPYLRGLSESKGRYVQKDNLFMKRGNPYKLLVADTIDNGYRDLEQIRESMIRARERGEILSLYGHDIVNNYVDHYKLPPDELEKIFIISKEVGLKSFTYKETYLSGKI